MNNFHFAIFFIYVNARAHITFSYNFNNNMNKTTEFTVLATIQIPIKIIKYPNNIGTHVYHNAATVNIIPYDPADIVTHDKTQTQLLNELLSYAALHTEEFLLPPPPSPPPPLQSPSQPPIKVDENTVSDETTTQQENEIPQSTEVIENAPTETAEVVSNEEDETTWNEIFADEILIKGRPKKRIMAPPPPPPKKKCFNNYTFKQKPGALFSNYTVRKLRVR